MEQVLHVLAMIFQKEAATPAHWKAEQRLKSLYYYMPKKEKKKRI
jgi:hypothetical protein